MENENQNIILIGMPGSGKTTIGRALARRLGKSFIDADVEITKRVGKTIPEIFDQQGEDSFRNIESEVISEISKKTNCVIATGGGCVLRDENYAPLHDNSIVLWIHRDLTLLPKNGRPLSQKTNIKEMFQHRFPRYRHFADISIDNNSSINDVAKKISEVYYEIINH